MFTYQMVAKELNEILDQATLLKTAAYEAGLHAMKSNDSMCETKLEDIKARSRDVAKLLLQLDNQIEYIRNQS